jgi:hypothetical protein
MLAIDLNAGSGIGGSVYMQSNYDFMNAKPLLTPTQSDDFPQVWSLPLQLGDQPNTDTYAEGDTDLIGSGDVVISDSFDYGELLDGSRVVGAAARLNKISKAETEGGILRVATFADGDFNAEANVR